MAKLWTLNRDWTLSLNGEVQALSWHYNPRDGFSWQLDWGWQLSWPMEGFVPLSAIGPVRT